MRLVRSLLLHMTMNRLPLSLQILSLLALVGCTETDDDTSTFSVTTYTTNWGADESTSFAFLGDNFAFLASEQHSGGIDANGDGDFVDSFPIAVDAVSKVETQLAVAAQGMVWVGEHLYLDVLEVNDGYDWDGSTMIFERVLLHWTDGMADPEFVTTLDLSSEIALVSTGELAIAATSGATSLMSSNTPLVVLEASEPTPSATSCRCRAFLAEFGIQ